MVLGVIGAGSWGTALAHVLAENFEKVLIWDVNKAVLVDIENGGVNRLYHPDIKLNRKIKPEHDLQNLVDRSEVIIVAIPTKYIRQTLSGINIGDEKFIISASKGIEVDSLKLISQIIQESLGIDRRYIYALSGPSFAKEVIKGLPTALTLAGDVERGRRLQKLLSAKSFRVYLSDDLAGVEVGGAIKNVIAIACGISDGLGMGNNARASLITRGLFEIGKVVRVYGGNPQTVYGLSGLGDLVLTATGELSRNRSFGVFIGRGLSVSEAEREVKQVIEGKTTVEAVNKIREIHKIELPISEMVYRIVYEGLNPEDAVNFLMNRDLKTEF